MIFGRVMEGRREGRKQEDGLESRGKNCSRRLASRLCLTLRTLEPNTGVMFVFMLNTSSRPARVRASFSHPLLKGLALLGREVN